MIWGRLRPYIDKDGFPGRPVLVGPGAEYVTPVGSASSGYNVLRPIDVASDVTVGGTGIPAGRTDSGLKPTVQNTLTVFFPVIL